ncbi:Major Facilitator Superfamily Domain-Containing Protein 2B [Manis pentadactyla]|nr:Major Facilitator Superfamily Domain-Containing Protein 2B [Manis pentadactyla]
MSPARAAVGVNLTLSPGFSLLAFVHIYITFYKPMSLFMGLVSTCACPPFNRDDVKVRRMTAEIAALLAGKEDLVISSCLKPWLDVSPGPP